MDLESLTGHERAIGELVLTRPAPGKHAARHAIAHIQKADLIKSIDPDMALFRAITGEEEAARSIFHSLQRLRYPEARQLDWHSHKQKAAVLPFMAAVERLFDQVEWVRAEAFVGKLRGKRAIQLRYIVTLPNRQPFALTCDPPLNLQVNVEGRAGLLEEEVAAVASEANFKSMKHFVDSAANDRNRILYATDKGIPTLGQDVGPLLATKRQNVFSMLVWFLLIDPYRQHQPFVCQALRSFLEMTKRLPDT